MKKILAVFSFILVGVLTGCGDDGEKVDIYTTIYPLEYITSGLVGDNLVVESIIQGSSDPHEFELTAKDVVNILEADKIYFISHYLESFMEDLEAQSDEDKFLEVADGVELIKYLDEDHGHDHDHVYDGDHDHDDEDHDHDHDHEHDHGEYDPHFWMSPLKMIEAMDYIKHDLKESYPELESEIDENYITLRDELLGLDELFVDLEENITIYNFIITHKSFSYLEDAYHLHQIAIKDENHSKDPTAAELEAIVEKAIELNIEYVLAESNISDQFAQTIANEIDAEILEVYNLTNKVEGEDYVSLMKKNIEAFKLALKY